MRKRTQTRWRRFALAIVPSSVVMVGLMVGIASGAVPVMVNVSGQTFKVSADKLEGDGFKQYSSAVVDVDGNIIPVAASEIGHAELTNMCQSVSLPKNLQKIVGNVTLVIEAGGGGAPAEAENLTIGLQELRGDATFKNIKIGTDGSVLGKDPGDIMSIKGTVGQSADTVRITGLEQTAYSTHAGTFRLKGLKMKVDTKGNECFDWG